MGARAVSLAGTGASVFGLINDIIAGKSAEQILLGMAFDIVLTASGAKLAGMAIDAVQGLRRARQVGNLTRATRNGYPSWTTVRNRYWNEVWGRAGPPKAKIKVRNTKTGRIETREVSMELHHIDGRGGPDPHRLENLKPVWPWEHATIDAQRRLGYEFLEVIRYLE